MAKLRIIDAIKANSLFEGVAPEHLETLAERARLREFDKDDHLFWTGDPGGTMYLVVTGRVAIEKEDADERVRTINLLGPGDVIGELSLFVDGARTADARAVEDTETLIVDGRLIDQLIGTSPALARNFIRLLAGKLAQATDRYLDSGKKLANRLATVLIAAVKERGGRDGHGRIVLPDSPSQAELAQRLNCSREHVNKVMRQLKDDEVVAVEGRCLVILNWPALKSLGR